MTKLKYFEEHAMECDIKIEPILERKKLNIK